MTAELFSDLLTRVISLQYKDATKSREKVICNLSVPHTALMLCLVKSPYVFIEDSPELAVRLYKDLGFFTKLLGLQRQVFLLPSPTNIELISRRIEALEGYLNDNSASLITSYQALESPIDLSRLKEDALILSTNMEIEREGLRDWLLNKGYREVSMVIDKGEFSHRSYIVDIFPTTEDQPLRIEFFGDLIESIRSFDIESQRSEKELSSIKVLAIVEGSTDKSLFEQLMDLKKAELFVSGLAKNETLPLNTEEVTLRIFHNPVNTGGIVSEETSLVGLGLLPQERRGFAEFVDVINRLNKPILAVLQSKAQAERLKDLLEEWSVSLPIVDLERVAAFYGRGCITVGNLSGGINLPDIIILTDREVFGERPSVKPSRPQKLSKILLNLEELKLGDWIVHKEHGIGRFRGIHRQRLGDYEQDLINIEYANGNLYIPADSIRLIQKYSASEGVVPVIDKLGSKNWQKTKLRARLGAEEMAKRLIKLYAERAVSRGFVFSEDTSLHREFDEFFVYQETPDQLRAIQEIKQAMQSDRPMDMLLCGDVGYGKTEVVMRAVFRAVYDKKQVAVLVPTTILAEQHYRTFKARFAGFDVRIATINRLRSPAERTKTLKALSRHEIDVIIGTHSLLRKDIAFADLGLLVIDEEHKFGVQQKELLKELRKNVDVIALTATPIPRTLQMSLSGIREMTIIETPPEDRISVKTFISVFNRDIVKEAIERESRRQGQVYYVYNRISGLEEKARMIRHTVGDLRIAIAHGDMKERELEKVMLDFMDRKIDVLVCTAIIGSGLDIPSANTIIIDRADLFGLADLYQLRGRVGRSNIQAYAYLLIPEEERLNEEAMKRLQAVQDLSYLGAGFRIALKDLEIRGAGNILGAEQSGHIHRVGFDLYMEMLEEAISELKGETIKPTINPEVRLLVSAYIPEDYITDITMRMSIYRRLSEAQSLEELSKLEDEMIDRFGKMPDQVADLIDLLKVKTLARQLFINKILQNNSNVSLYFQQADTEPYGLPKDYLQNILKLLYDLHKHDKSFRFIEGGFSMAIKDKQEVLKCIKEFLASLEREYKRRAIQ